MTRSVTVNGAPYLFDQSISGHLEEVAARVKELRSAGRLTPDALRHIRRSFRLKSIYHSNAIEGNRLSIGETRQVVELGMTLTGQSLKDQAEAKNLGAALDFLEELASDNTSPLTEHAIRQVHSFVLRGIDDDNAGRYRTVQVEISGSAYHPTAPESVPASMAEFGSWLASVSVVGNDFATSRGLIIAAAAHAWFVMIHPFIDGNGRVARLLMNLLLMRFGIPIAIITKDDRQRYYDALEESQSSNLTPLLVLASECVAESLEYWEEAARETKATAEFAKSIAERLARQPMVKASNEYEVWKSAMELLRGHFRQIADQLASLATLYRIFFKDFGHLDFEKFVALRQGQSTKRTWFFRIDIRVGDKAARYLFFFGFPSGALRDRCSVTLFTSREDPPGSYFYTALDRISAPNCPPTIEIGYDMKQERFVCRSKGGGVAEAKVEGIAQRFIEAVVKCHFES